MWHERVVSERLRCDHNVRPPCMCCTLQRGERRAQRQVPAVQLQSLTCRS